MQRQFRSYYAKLILSQPYLNTEYPINWTKKAKASKRLSILEALHTSGNRPEWMVLEAIPVMPPDLRPMVQLEGGRFATSDLNDLYRRVVNRNNRLTFVRHWCSDMIIRNEKECFKAVDVLISNGKRCCNRFKWTSFKIIRNIIEGKRGRFVKTY